MEATDNGRWVIHRRDEGGQTASTMEMPLRPDKSGDTAGVCWGVGKKMVNVYMHECLSTENQEWGE